MAAGARAIVWLFALVAPGLTTPVVAQAPRAAYHLEVRTGVRQDPPAAAHAPAWGSWADAPGAWSDAMPGGTPVPTPQADAPAWTHRPPHRRPDPNLRVRTASGEGEIPPWDLQMDGDRRWYGGRTPDDRARHGWRAGWHGAAPGWGGVWWYGWGDDWPAYAGGDGDWGPWSGGGTLRMGYGQGRGGWHGGFDYSQGWDADRSHGMFGFGHDRGGGRVIALPSVRGE